MIRYRGTSPKLGGSQGECPYLILNSPFCGEGDDGGDEGEILSSDIHGSGPTDLTENNMKREQRFLCDTVIDRFGKYIYI